MKTVELKQNVTAINQQELKQPVNMPEFRKRLRYAGFNAIELSLVLGVIAVAVVGVIRIMGGNTDKQNSTQMVNDVSTIVSNVKNAYSSSNSGYSTLSTKAAIDGRMVPQDLKTANDKIQNQFQGGEVTIEPGSGDFFTITYTKVPSSICNSAVNTLGGASFLTIVINDQPAVYDVNAGTALDASKVATACSQGKEQSTVVFTAS
ncbi:MAG: type pilin [Burkholderiales bacterium]|jgi:Flp pilus assembly pilin Flp|nr:type pilin [Burkholderiales bacterium]